MRSIYYHPDGRRSVADDVDRYTHVIVGQLNAEAEKPAGYDLDLAEINALEPEEREQTKERIRVFERAKTAGRYRSKAMRWTISEDAAITAVAGFADETHEGKPKWANIRIMLVSQTLEDA